MVSALGSGITERWCERTCWEDGQGIREGVRGSEERGTDRRWWAEEAHLGS